MAKEGEQEPAEIREESIEIGEEPVAAREQSAPEPFEPAPRGNRFSEPDDLPDQEMPPPLPG